MNQGIIQEQMKLSEGFASADMFERLERLSHLPQQVPDYPQVILQEHLYGVDLDPEAAEIATVNLTMQAFADSRQKKLPQILNENIKVGNSLISGTEEELKPYFGEAWAEKRPFNWEQEFPVVMRSGGFDVVIGNPPYVDSESMVSSGQQPLRDWITKHFKMAKGNWDIYIAFLDLGLALTHANGTSGFITPDKWISKSFGDELRKGTIGNIASLAKVGREVFKSSKVDAIIAIFSKRNSQALDILDFREGIVLHKRTVEKQTLSSPFAFDHLFSHHLDFLLKIEAVGKQKVSDFGECENACATSDAYKLEPLIVDSPGDFDSYRQLKVVNTGTIGRYFFKWGKHQMTYLRHKYLCPIVERDEFLSLFTNSYAKKALKPKIVIKGLNLLDACLDVDGSVIPGKTTLIVTSSDVRNLRYLLGILNSGLAVFYLKERYPASSYNQGITFTKNMINSLPLPQATGNQLDGLVALVERMLALQERLKPLRGTGLTAEQDLQREIEQTDRKIDTLVYEMYGLSEGERRLVAGQ